MAAKWPLLSATSPTPRSQAPIHRRSHADRSHAADAAGKVASINKDEGGHDFGGSVERVAQAAGWAQCGIQRGVPCKLGRHPVACAPAEPITPAERAPARNQPILRRIEIPCASRLRSNDKHFSHSEKQGQDGGSSVLREPTIWRAGARVCAARHPVVNLG